MTLTDNEKKFLSAAKDGDLETIKSLITNGLISLENNDQIRNGDGDTALHLASGRGHLQIVRFLIEENSVYVDGKDNDGRTALHFASVNGHVNVMKLLIVNGANVNRQRNDGDTPLHFASFWGHLSAVKFLLEMGADPLIQNKYNWTALDLAREEEDAEVASAMEQHIQRPQQIEELLRCNDTLPIAIWPNAFSRLNSVNFIHQLLSELPQLFQQTPEKAEKGSHSTKRLIILQPPPKCHQSSDDIPDLSSDYIL